MTVDPSVPAGSGGSGPWRNTWLQPFFCTTIGLLGNALLSAGKIIVGLLAGSAALVADGYHSLADVLSDIGILLALKAASQPPDENHPYGHHSFETLGAVIVALFMLGTALLIGKEAIEAIIAGDFKHPNWVALAASLVSVVVKEIMARYTMVVGKLHNSPALLANGAMHRADAISSLAAAAGIGAAMAGWPIFDSIGALVIALFILRMGWELLIAPSGGRSPAPSRSLTVVIVVSSSFTACLTWSILPSSAARRAVSMRRRHSSTASAYSSPAG